MSVNIPKFFVFEIGVAEVLSALSKYTVSACLAASIGVRKTWPRSNASAPCSKESGLCAVGLRGYILSADLDTGDK